jgi:hypothetical protein
MELRGREVSR